KRHDRIKLTLTNHHSAGVLTQMTRQILHGKIQLKEFLDTSIAQVQSRIFKLALSRVLRIFPLPRVHQTRQTSERLIIKAESLADFACCRSPSIRDDVRCHCCAKFSVALINILNRAFALIAARQIEIDVRPFAAFLGKKSLEQKFHADWIDRGNSQAITNRAIRRRTAALNQDSLPLTKFNDVPNDQKVTFELQLLDQLQFMFDLFFC